MDEQTLQSAVKAFDDSKDSITISDATRPEMPLIYVNRGFEVISGYTRNEIVGKNCRFLQGPMRDQSGVHAIRDAIARKTSCLVELKNFRKDGGVFFNRLSLCPVFNKQGKLVYYIGLQTNVTALKELEAKILQHVAQQST